VRFGPAVEELSELAAGTREANRSAAACRVDSTTASRPKGLVSYRELALAAAVDR
jgi:hypothetical protein